MKRQICITVCREEEKFLPRVTVSLKPQDRLESITLFVSTIYDGEVRWNKKTKILKHKKYFDNHKRFHSIVCL
jgi:hypothetical protein